MPEVAGWESPDRASGGSSLTLVENALSGPLDPWQAQLLASNSRVLEALNINLQYSAEGIARAICKNQVGTASLQDVSGRILMLQVVPKLRPIAVFRMLQVAQRGISVHTWHGGIVPLDQVTPSEMLFRLFGEEVQAFLASNDLRLYVKKRRVAPIPRGKLDLQRYASRHSALGTPHLVPTDVYDLTADSFENRVIRHALDIALRTGAGIGVSAGTLALLWKQARHLADVPTERISLSDLVRLRYTRATEHYRSIHSLCGEIIRGSSGHFGGTRSLPYFCFSIGMPKLYERYLNALMRGAFANDYTALKASLTHAIDGLPSGELELDGLLTQGSRRTVIEAKYRDALDDTEGLRSVPNAHIYQAVAYATNVNVRAHNSFIVYPAVDTAEPFEVHAVTSDFSWLATIPTTVRIAALDLNASPSSVVNALQRLLGATALVPQPKS